MITPAQVLSILHRQIRRHPRELLSMALSLALGMLLLVLILAAINGFLLRPLAVPEADELVRVREVQQASNGERNVFNVAPAVWQLWQQESLRSIDDIAVGTASSVTLGFSQAPEQRRAGLISANFLAVLGVQPALGRGFLPDADDGEGAAEVIISDALWRERFAASPTVIGQSLLVDGRLRQVVGVMPPAMSHPYEAKLWLPIALGERLHQRVGNYLYALARVQPGVSLDSAQEELSALVNRLHGEHASLVDAVAVELTPLREELLGDLRPALWVLGIASALAFLVALLNCATLTGLRALRQRSTVAVRAALGAGRRHLLVDAAIRHAGTSVLAALLALLALEPLSGPLMGLAGSASINEFDVAARADVTTIVLTLGVAALAALVLTVVETATLALVIRQPTALREARMTQSRSAGRWLQAVTAGQLVASIVVVSGAVLVTQGYLNQVHGDRGFDPQQLWLVDVALPATRYEDTPRRLDYVQSVVERLRATPGVIAASAATTTPDEGGSRGATYVIPGQQPPPLGYHLTNHRLVAEGYFQTMAIPLLAGRDFGPADFVPDARSVVVSREFAERSWPGRDPLGQTLQRHRHDELLTVVGVVGDVREAEQQEGWTETAAWYLPASQGSDYDFNAMTFVIRLAGDPALTLPAPLQAIAEVDPNLALVDIAPMRDRLAATYEREIYTARLFAAFAVVAILIAALGAYALLAFAVASRQAEYGLRLALGESPPGLVRRLWRQAGQVMLTAVAVGLPLSWASNQLLRAQLSSVPEWSLTLAGVALACSLGMQLLAFIGPSLRALRASPLVLLRGS